MLSLRNAALLAVGLAGVGLKQAAACRCVPRDLCELFDEAELVVHATPFARESTADAADPVSYAMTTIELFKGEQIDAQRLTITTAGSSAACGVYMEIGEEYLVGLYREEEGQFAANTCFLFKSWVDVTKEELTLLTNGCVDDGCDDETRALVPNGCDDTCGGRCGEFQECVFYAEVSEYYCTDFCDPYRCPLGQVCTLETVQCVRAPCPPLATCLDEDPCSGTCDKAQTCIQYLQSFKWYCSNE